MSVLKENRSLSKAEFVKGSRDIAVRSINLLSRLSARYARVMADDVKSCSVEGFSSCVKANSVYPTSFMRCTLREEYILRAKANYDALDGLLAIIYEILRSNPEGAFTDSSGKKALDKKKAEEKLDKMVDILGDAIDREQALLKGQLDFIAERRRKIFNTLVDNYMKKGFSRSQAIKMANVEKEVQLQTVESTKVQNPAIAYANAVKEMVQQGHAMECAEDLAPGVQNVPEQITENNNITTQDTPVPDTTSVDSEIVSEGTVTDTIVPENTPVQNRCAILTQGVDASGEAKRLDKIFGITQ